MRRQLLVVNDSMFSCLALEIYAASTLHYYSQYSATVNSLEDNPIKIKIKINELRLQTIDSMHLFIT